LPEALTPQEEYRAALAQYRAAQARLVEAKRHFDPKTDPEAIAVRRAKQAEYRAKRLAAWNDPEAKAQREREDREHSEQMRVWMDEYERRRRIA
jgi:hypothetical protein